MVQLIKRFINPELATIRVSNKDILPVVLKINYLGDCRYYLWRGGIKGGNWKGWEGGESRQKDQKGKAEEGCRGKGVLWGGGVELSPGRRGFRQQLVRGGEGLSVST